MNHFTSTNRPSLDRCLLVLERIAARSGLEVVDVHVVEEPGVIDHCLWLDVGDGSGTLAAIGHRTLTGRHGNPGFMFLGEQHEQHALRAALVKALGVDDLDTLFDDELRAVQQGR